MKIKTFGFLLLCCLIFPNHVAYSSVQSEQYNCNNIENELDDFDDLDSLINIAIEKKVITKDLKFKGFTPFQMAVIKVSKPFLSFYLFSVVKYRELKEWVIVLFNKWFINEQKNNLPSI